MGKGEREGNRCVLPASLHIRSSDGTRYLTLTFFPVISISICTWCLLFDCERVIIS